LSTSVRPTPPSGLVPIPAALASLGDIAARLASSETVSEVLPGVLEAVRLALHAHECTLWLDTVNGLVRSYGVGDDATRPEEVAGMIALAASFRDGLVITPLMAGSRSLGALSARVDRPLADEERVLFAAVGNMIAPPLSYAEHSHLLEAEVEARARQIGEQWLFMEKVVDSLPVGLYVIDREFRIQTWNRKRETGLQGVSREEAIGRTIFEILHRQPAEVLRREFDEVFQTGRIQQFQMESTLTGDLRVYRITKIPMRLDDVNVTHVITIGEDVSEWKEAEARFAQTEKLAAIGQLAAGVMHEINNPLATIAACAESLELADPGAPAPVLDGLRLIQSEVRRCKGITDSLLDFSRPKSADKTLVDVNAVIERTVFILKHHTRFKKLSVRLELDPSLGPVVLANEEQLVQVFMALLLNAMDAMREQGTVELRTRWGEGAGSVLAEVVDHGEGIRRADLPKIFEPFFTTKAPGRGTGLGLSICYAIVAEHGGRIEVDSTPGEGSAFRIVLPRADDQETARE
jgi:two-component system NtrC family sensor kinase